MALPEMKNFMGEARDPLFRGSFKERTRTSLELYFRPLVQLWRSPQRSALLLVLLAVSFGLAIVPVLVQSLVANEKAQVAKLSNELQSAEERIHKLEGKKVYGATDETEKRLAALEKSVAGVAALEKQLADARELASKSGEEVKRLAGEIKRIEEALTTSRETVNSLKGQIKEAMTIIGKSSSTWGGGWSGEAKGLLRLPAERSFALRLALEDPRTKLRCEWPVWEKATVEINGRTEPINALRKMEGHKATFEIVFGRVVSVRVEVAGKEFRGKEGGKE
jgi:uncharacterized coiled-coil protein SlyX